MICAIGIDVGGTGIALALVTSAGAILDRREFPTGDYDGSIAQAIAACRELGAVHPVAGVGLCCPGPMNLQTGEILNPFTMSWQGRNPVKDLRDALGLPVYLENDADAALLGEIRFGAARGYDSAVMVTFGTGVGGAVYAHGRLLRGEKKEYPEIGHMPVLPDDLECYCGVRGCLEIVASGTALLKLVELLDLSSIDELFVESDKTRKFHRRLQNLMSGTAAILVRCYAPGIILLGGGVIDHQYEAYARPMRQQIAKMPMLPPGGTTIARAQLGNDAGLIGAASLVFSPVA